MRIHEFCKPIAWLLLTTVLCVGCQKSEERKSQVELPAWMTDDAKPPEGASPLRLVNAPAAASLKLNVKVGDQFPLRKTVVQELTQQSLSSTPQQSYSKLETLLAIQVVDQQQDRLKLSVRYDRIRYQHQIADDVLEFDSTLPANEIAPVATAYRNMINDGFKFWIGEDNQIVEVDGLSEFLGRCLKAVPQEQRQDVVLGIEAGSGDTGIANFVDNTIGLLPFGQQTSPGDSWERQQHVTRPLPMIVNNLYTLKELTGQMATIDIRGTISPSTTLNNLNASGVSVVVNGGHTLGSCVLYRETGLPKESRIDRQVDMTVTLPNSVQFKQTKRMTTTIETYPPNSSGTPTIVGAPREQVIQQVSGEQ